MSLRKRLETFIGFFLPLSFHTAGSTVAFVVVLVVLCSRLLVLSLSSCSNKNDGHVVALTVFLCLLVKDQFV